MGVRPRSTYARIGLALLVGAAAVLIPAGPAQADPPQAHVSVPPGVGWSAEWHYATVSDTPGIFGFSMDVPHASIDGSGFDQDTSRDVGIAITDTSPDPSLCAFLTVTGNDDYYFWVVCDGTAVVNFHDSTPSDYTFTFSLRNSSSTWQETSIMVLPSSSNYPQLRSWPYHGSWEYLSNTVVHYSLVRPGGANVDGYATGYPARVATTTITGSTCTSTAVYNPSLVDAVIGCASAPATLGLNLNADFKVVNCLSVRGGVLPGQLPAPARCIPLYVR